MDGPQVSSIPLVRIDDDVGPAGELLLSFWREGVSIADPYRLLMLTEKIPELTDLAGALQTLADDLEVVVVEEMTTAIGRLWMEELRGSEGRSFHLILLPDTPDGRAVLMLFSGACCIKVASVVLTTSSSVGLSTAGKTATQKIGVSAKKGVEVVSKALEISLEALREQGRDVVFQEILLRVAKGVNLKEPTVREVLLALLEMANPSQEQISTSRVPPPPEGLKRLRYTLKHPSEVFPYLRPESLSSPEDVGATPSFQKGGLYEIQEAY